MLLLSLAFRNALRNRRRSALTAITVTFGVALLTMAMAWVNGVMGGMLDMAAGYGGTVRVVDADYAKKEQLFPLQENMPDTAPVEAAIRAVPGVDAVFPRIQMPVTAAAGDELGERFGLVQGAPIEFFTQKLKLDAQIQSGRMLAADGEVVIGLLLVEQIAAKLGDDVYLLGQTQDGSMSPVKLKLVGIADLGSAPQNRQIFMTLEKARWLADIEAGATELLVYGGERDDAAILAAAVRTAPGLEGLDVKGWNQRKPFSGMLGIARAIQTVAAGVIVFITALGVLNTMLMSVMERTAEIGVLRALGLRRRQVITLFVTEALGISLIGGLVGAALGGLGGYYLQVNGVDLGSAVDKLPGTIPMHSTIHAQLTPGILAGGVVLGLVMAVIGGALPAFRASRVEPVEAMRSRH